MYHYIILFFFSFDLLAWGLEDCSLKCERLADDWDMPDCRNRVTPVCQTRAVSPVHSVSLTRPLSTALSRKKQIQIHSLLHSSSCHHYYLCVLALKRTKGGSLIHLLLYYGITFPLQPTDLPFGQNDGSVHKQLSCFLGKYSYRI